MKCSNCGKTISEDSLFCEHCGHKIEKAKEKNNKEDELLEDSNKIKRKIIEHLEFLGYEVNITETVNRYGCVHTTRQSMIVTFANGISFVTLYKLDKNKIEKNRDKALELINKMNNYALLSSFSISFENDGSSLVCGSWYPNIYSKKTFADFLEFFEGDIRRALQLEGAMDIFS